MMKFFNQIGQRDTESNVDDTENAHPQESFICRHARNNNSNNGGDDNWENSWNSFEEKQLGGDFESKSIDHDGSEENKHCFACGSNKGHANEETCFAFVQSRIEFEREIKHNEDQDSKERAFSVCEVTPGNAKKGWT